MITFQGINYPTRRLKVQLLTDGIEQEVLVSTESLSEVLTANEGNPEADTIDSQIYFFLPDEEINGEITELDQPIKVISEVK